MTQLSREPMLLSGLAATADVDIERVQFAPFAFDPFSAFDIAQVPLIFCAPLDLQAAGARRQISACRSRLSCLRRKRVASSSGGNKSNAILAG